MCHTYMSVARVSCKPASRVNSVAEGCVTEGTHLGRWMRSTPTHNYAFGRGAAGAVAPNACDVCQ